MAKILEIAEYDKLIGTEINTRSYDGSDYWSLENSRFAMKFEGKKSEKVGPGIYNLHIGQMGIKFNKRRVTSESNLSYLNSFDISDRLQVFFSKKDVFIKKGLQPRRGILLYGPPGCGKTHNIMSSIVKTMSPKAVCFFISMDNVDMAQVVEELENQILADGVDQLYIVIEDLGGGEMTDKANKMFISSSSLLSFLDGNSLPWKDIPIVTISTTNYPKNFLENILDRPGRFDDVVEVGYPSSENIVRYISELIEAPLSDFEIHSLKGTQISIAHAREAAVRYLVYGEPIHISVKRMVEYSQRVRKDMSAKFD